MDIPTIQKQLTHQAEAIAALASGLTADQIQWKPDPESWSVLEVINHLVYEEVHDFRRILDHIMHSPSEPWPEFQPLENSVEISNPEQSLQQSLVDFQSERKKSLEWLAGLADIDWDTITTAPWGGKMTAGDMAASWLAHDLLHLRQLVELRFAINASASKPYDIEYAGKW